MRFSDLGKSVEELVGLFGYSRQHYYKQLRGLEKQRSLEQQIIDFVVDKRESQKRIGTQKLQHLWNQQEGYPRIGRDRLYDLLRRHHLLIRKRKRYRPKLTDGNGNSIYKDLRKDLEVNRPNQLWCSDITYIDLNNKHRHSYLICFTDEYSHLIVGYHVSYHMKTEGVLQALSNAIEAQMDQSQGSFDQPLIIHTDRGSQFKSAKYIEKTDRYGIQRSMTRAGKSYENPVAERLNGILKNELMRTTKFQTIEQARKEIDRAIQVYNEQRPHLSCDMLTPVQAHQTNGPLKKRWRQRKP